MQIAAEHAALVDLARWIDAHTSGLSLPGDERWLIAICCLDVAIENQAAITLLHSSELYDRGVSSAIFLRAGRVRHALNLARGERSHDPFDRFGGGVYEAKDSEELQAAIARPSHPLEDDQRGTGSTRQSYSGIGQCSPPGN
jgi:hypothetical protein